MANQSESEQRLKFFELLFGVQKGIFCLATTDPRSPKTTFQQTFFRWPEESLRLEQYIIKAQHRLNVYFCINLLTKTTRTKDNCLPTRLVWADLDEVAPDSIEDIPPPIVVETSPGRWHGIWRSTVELPPFQAEEYSKRIAYHVGADKSGWDLGQLLRVPLTKNFKYDPPSPIQIVRALESEAVPLAFEALRPQSEILDVGDVPEIKDGEALQIISMYGNSLEKIFFDLYVDEPQEDWSKTLWKLINICFRAGMEEEEVFVVAASSACNKYSRDGRPIRDLWREVLKAAEGYKTKASMVKLFQMPVLVPEPQTETILDEYRNWASELTDAPAQFHDLSITIALSAIVCNSVRYQSGDQLKAPLLWGLLLGESTLTRKTTSMKLATQFPLAFDPELIMGTDGSPEGIMTAVAQRPNRVSIFYRDEVSGFFARMQKKDYMAGMMEDFTNMYDSPQIIRKLLRKETIICQSPLVIIFAGGVSSKVFEAVDETFIEQGFLPRFLVARGHPPKLEDIQPEKEPTPENREKKMRLMNRLADIAEYYTGSIEQNIGGQKMMSPKIITAKVSQEIFFKKHEFGIELLKAARESPLGESAYPSLSRLNDSMFNMAVILAASRQKPVDGNITVEMNDLLNAAWYCQEWGKNSVELIVNAGRTPAERKIEKVYVRVLTNPGINRAQLFKDEHLIARDGAMIIQTLEERGMIMSTKQGKGTRYWPT